MSSEGPESTDIKSEQAEQESASIVNALRALMPEDICRKQKVWNVFDYSCFDSYNNMSFGKSLKHFWGKNEA